MQQFTKEKVDENTPVTLRNFKYDKGLRRGSPKRFIEEVHLLTITTEDGVRRITTVIKLRTKLQRTLSIPPAACCWPQNLLVLQPSVKCSLHGLILQYVHPALSARKVLLTENFCCKLYDFWPVRLSSNRVGQIFKQVLHER